MFTFVNNLTFQAYRFSLLSTVECFKTTSAVNPFCRKSVAATGRMRRLALAPVWVGLIAAFGTLIPRRRVVAPPARILTVVNSQAF